jgi:hypothetical protein
MRIAASTIFLVVQLVSIVYAQIAGSERYFCWAPNDYIVSYQSHVECGGHILDPEQARARYRFPSLHIYQNMVTHMENVIRQYETTYGRNDHASVILRYSNNGTPPREWLWPQP